MNTVDVIDGAIKAIEINGWCQNELVSNEGQVCLRGALFAGAGGKIRASTGYFWMDDSDVDYDAYIDANEVVCLEIQGWNDIPRFNDDSGTSQEDVVLVLKRTRAALED